jgi:hypothetical protein
MACVVRLRRKPYTNDLSPRRIVQALSFIDRERVKAGDGVTHPGDASDRIVRVSAGEGYTLHVLFDDGMSGDVNISARLFGPVFEPLHDPLLFAQVRVDEYGALCWPNGADLAPDALYRTISPQVDPGVLAP